MNLSGARGILVNITAGMDMAIGEFEEVGTEIQEFASEDATVVVGTVIDIATGRRDKLKYTLGRKESEATVQAIVRGAAAAPAGVGG